MTTARYSKGIIATTRVVRNVVLTAESLEDAAKQITDGQRKLVVLADHDHTCPPLGMIVGGQVVPIGDDQHGLEAVYAFYGPPIPVELGDGETGYLQELPEHPHPLTSSDFGETDHPTIVIDPSNFGGHVEATTFLQGLKNIAPASGYETGLTERRSILPDPEVVFGLGLSLSASWLAARMSNALADAIEPKLKEFLDVVFETVSRTAQSALPVLRPITYIVKVNGNPSLDFVVRSRDVDLVMRAYSGNFSEVDKQVALLRKRFDAEMIQFLLDDKGQWRFNYLLTRDGKVIGSKLSFHHRDVVLAEMESQVRAKLASSVTSGNSG